MSIQERSAGFIIFRREGNAGPRLFLLLDYGKHWDYPKGHLDLITVPDTFPTLSLTRHSD
ncbi:MAG TPA: hypothetical protein VL992_17540 [Tepidisphaeraceae bacterium]|nr:hypothetical protein [Tepidisphaeraceae bacterium]